MADIYVSSGVTSSGVFVSSYDSMYILSGGVAKHTIVYTNGYMDVLSGGMANYVSAASGATVAGWSLRQNQLFTVIDGDGVHNTINIATVSAFAKLGSGGVANSTTVSANGSLNVLNGAVTNSTLVTASGYMHVSAGGVANSTAVNTDGYMYISAGGVANSTAVNTDGYMYISAGGVANSTFVSSGGRISVESGGVAKHTIVQVNGYMDVLSGGVANYVSAVSGATVAGWSLRQNQFFTIIDDDGVHNTINIATVSASAKLGSGGVANSTTVSANGSLNVLNGAVTNSTLVNANGYMHVSAGGVANSTVVNTDGYMYISAGGVANDTSAFAGNVYVGGVANSTFVSSGGRISVESGGVANHTIVYTNGYMDVLSGGMANYVSAASGATVAGWSLRQNQLFTVIDGDGVHNTINIATVSASAKLGSGGVANSTTVSANGSLNVLNGAVTNSTLVTANGYMHVSAGGVANSTVVNTDGYMYISAGGVANDTSAFAGNVYVGGVANSTFVSSGGRISVESGGVAKHTIVQVNGYMDVLSGGMANYVSAVSGATVAGWSLRQNQFFTIIDDDGVHNTINIATVSASAKLGSGGVANSTTVSANGSLNVLNGAVTNSTLVDSNARMSIEDGGVANSTIVNNWGNLYISAGGVANDTSAFAGNVYVSGVANRTTVNSGGYLFFVSGGVASCTTVNSGGYMSIDSGCVAKRTIVNTNGYMNILSGGALSGRLQINGGTVSAMTGAIIDFTVAEQQNAFVALINDWSLISGGNNADYTLTVKSGQESGIYALACGASGFADSVTVKTTENTVLGTLSVGETKTFGDTDYTLFLNAGTLLLTVTGEEPVSKPAKSDVDGNNISDIVFQYTGGNYQIGFWMNGTNTWQGQGIGQPQDWELIGAYDMDQDGKADIVMRGNIQIGSDKGAYIGYYVDGDVNNWQNISYLNNPNDIDWRLAIGNITGNEGCNSLVWYSPELGALGIWTDGTDNWIGLNGGYDSSWTLEGCGDFNGDGKDDILFSHEGNLYCTDIDNSFRSLGGWGTDWKVCTTGDFSGDGKDDIILQNGNMVVKFEDGLAENWESVGVMDATDWFIVGAGDYNGDQTDDLLVRQYSTGMLGYYESGDMDKWVEVGRGVDMNWTVIA